MAEVEFLVALRGTMGGGDDLSNVRATVGEALTGTTNVPYLTPYVLNQTIGSIGGVHFATIAQGALADTAIQTVAGGSGITVDDSDPRNLVISATGGSGTVESVTAGSGISVDNTDPANPVVANIGLIDITAGSGIAINKTNPRNPVITATGGGGGGGTVDTIVAGPGISVDSTDPLNPEVSNDGVLSVDVGSTGILSIDNTDPQNPIISAPAFGTTAGTVMEGDDSRIADALQGANNLSDVDNATTAFGNIKQAATTSAAGVVELATAAEIRSNATGDKALTAENIKDASAIVTLTDAATVSVDWSAFINADVTFTATRTLGNPTNVAVGTYRSIIVKGDGATERLISFASNYKGDLPTAAVTSTAWLQINLFAYTSTHIVVTSCKAL